VHALFFLSFSLSFRLPFLFLFHFRHNFALAFPREKKRDQLENVTRYAEWSHFAFQHFFGNLTYCQKIRAFQHFSRTPVCEARLAVTDRWWQVHIAQTQTHCSKAYCSERSVDRIQCRHSFFSQVSELSSWVLFCWTCAKNIFKCACTTPLLLHLLNIWFYFGLVEYTVRLGPERPAQTFNSGNREAECVIKHLIMSCSLQRNYRWILPLPHSLAPFYDALLKSFFFKFEFGSSISVVEKYSSKQLPNNLCKV